MAAQIRVSQKGFEELQKKYDYMIQVKRVEVAQKLKEARSYGDLSENAEYDEAKNEQAIVEAEIQELKEKIDNAVIISDSDLSADEINVGTYVKLIDTDENDEFEIQVVGSTESDPDNDRISEDSPVGRACIGKKEGDTFEVETPGGIRHFKVLSLNTKSK
ncbi:MAG: transcription elongation factor GreA [Ruminococcus sp.]|jgi:transcription elongation factor GreA|nr:transcription elongation factor GreA [Ruminococcus sp.]